MKKTNSNLNYIFEPKKTNTTNTTNTNLTVDIDFENKKSIELYNKFNTKPRFIQKIILNQSLDKVNKIHGFCIFSCICIFLASFPYFNFFSFSFRSVVI